MENKKCKWIPLELVTIPGVPGGAAAGASSGDSASGATASGLVASGEFSEEILTSSIWDRLPARLERQSSAKKPAVRRVKTGEMFRIEKDEFVLGKSDDADFKIKNNSTISRKHLKISKAEEEKYFAEDLGSTNHSYINGKKIDSAKAELKDGDHFILSDEEFIFIV